MTERAATGPRAVPRERLMDAEREAALRARLCARDERALAELVEAATPWLLGVAQGILRDEAEAEEVVLETLRAAWDHVRPASEDPRPLVPWLLRIARNRAIDRLRARRRTARRLAATAGDLRDAVPPVEPDEAATPGWHVHRAVHAALDALPEERRVVVGLAFFGGLTHSEIAERLAIPVGTVKTRMRLAYDQLRTALAPLAGWVG